MRSEKKYASGVVLQSFDEQFPNAQLGFKTDEGIVKVFENSECHVCGRRTTWFHLGMAVCLCSLDCLTRYPSKQPID